MSRSANRILSNLDNAARRAAITASAQRPSTDIRLLAQSRSGGGELAIGGAFTGMDDAVFEAEIISTAADTLRASKPVVKGIGNGTVEVKSIRPTAVAQGLTLTLADAGTQSTAAKFDFYGTELAARTVGEVGNTLSITAKRHLTRNATRYSTLKALASGATEMDAAWADWGQPASPDAAVPMAALRFQFEGHDQVYRTWKSWQKGGFVYHIDPAPVVEVAADTKVFFITGDYEVTVKQGATKETYRATTIHDFLTALQARSALVEVRGAVAQDRTTGGMAVTDIPLNSAAHARPAQNVPAGFRVRVLGVAAGAPTENIFIRSADGDNWQVEGSVSGVLAAAKTGEEHNGQVRFVIEDRRLLKADGTPDKSAQRALEPYIHGKYHTSRGKDEAEPSVCFKPIALGARATNLSVTFTYKRRPDPACSCDKAQALPLSAACLGLATSLTGGLMLPEAGMARRDQLWQWLSQFIASNVQLAGDNIGAAATDINLAENCAHPLNDALDTLYGKAVSESRRDAALVIWDQALTELKNDLAAYGGVRAGAYAPWGNWRPGAEYINASNGHRYRLNRILTDKHAEVGAVDMELVARSDPKWKTDGSAFTIEAANAEHDRYAMVKFLGKRTLWGEFITGREVHKMGMKRVMVNGSPKEIPGSEWWRVTAMTVDGAAVTELPAGVVWRTETYKDENNTTVPWHGHDVRGDTADSKEVVVSFEALATLVDSLVPGREFINSQTNNAYIVESVTVGGEAADVLPIARWPRYSDTAIWKTSAAAFQFRDAAAANAPTALVFHFADMGVQPAVAGIDLRDYDRIGRYALSGSEVKTDTSTDNQSQTSKTAPPAGGGGGGGGEGAPKGGAIRYRDVSEQETIYTGPPSPYSGVGRRPPRRWIKPGFAASDDGTVSFAQGSSVGISPPPYTAPDYPYQTVTRKRTIVEIFRTISMPAVPGTSEDAVGWIRIEPSNSRHQAYLKGLGITLSSAGMAGAASSGGMINESASTRSRNQSTARIDSKAWTKMDEAALFDKALAYFPKKFRAKMDHALSAAGLNPKPDASGEQAGSACWHDHGGTHWWEDTSGRYMPAFTNKPYHSVVRGKDGAMRSTQEFGFGLVVPCAHLLKEGDSITITIGNVDDKKKRGATGTARSDAILIPVVAASAALFVGGVDGNDSQRWAVKSSLGGSLPDYIWQQHAPADYSAAGAPLVLRLAPGGIPFEVGDQVSLALEGGRLRWRMDGGAWTEAAIFDGAIDLGQGLSLTARAGAAPSFVEGEKWRWQAVATYGLSRLRQPRAGQGFAFDGDQCVVDVDLGAPSDIENVLLALHSLPAGAAVALSGGINTAAEWSHNATASAGAILLPAERARYLKISISGAGSGAAIGWLFAGRGWQPSVSASEISIVRQYALLRSETINPAAWYRGSGAGGRWAWRINEGGALAGDNANRLLEIIDHSAKEGLEPVCLVADVAQPDLATMATFETDDIRLDEIVQWASDGAARRLVSVELNLRGVLQ